MSLQLVKPNKKYLPSVVEAVAEYMAAPSQYEISAVRKMIEAKENDFATYFDDVEKNSQGIGLKAGYVPNTVYWLVDDDKYIGTFDFRHYLTPSLEEIGGHIAYQIRPSELRKGYASKGLELCLEKAKEMGVEQALVTCDEQNSASYGTMHKLMLKAGGHEAEPIKKDNLIERRVWINTR